MEQFSALLAICAGIHQSLMNSLYTGQSRGALMYSLICAWINGWVNHRETGDLRCHPGHYDVIGMSGDNGKSKIWKMQYWTLVSHSSIAELSYGVLCDPKQAVGQTINPSVISADSWDATFSDLALSQIIELFGILQVCNEARISSVYWVSFLFYICKWDHIQNVAVITRSFLSSILTTDAQ